jgi:hypothetical protein
MKYKHANITVTKAIIGDMREKIDIETGDMLPKNDLSGDHIDDIITIAADVWAAVEVNEQGVERMLSINTDKEEIITHIFYCRYWNADFLEARFIRWNGIRYRIVKPKDPRNIIGLNRQIKFPCVLKGSISKEANTW